MQGVGRDDIVGLEGSIPLEGHGRGIGIEDEGGTWPTGAKGVRKIHVQSVVNDHLGLC